VQLQVLALGSALGTTIAWGTDLFVLTSALAMHVQIDAKPFLQVFSVCSTGQNMDVLCLQHVCYCKQNRNYAPPAPRWVGLLLAALSICRHRFKNAGL
jgi:hypothetical protein